MLSSRFHDDVNIGSRGHSSKTPGRAGANLRKENPGGRGGTQTSLTGKGQERISKNVINTPGYNQSGQMEPLFKGGKVNAQQTQSISRAFALLDKTNKTPHPKSRKAVSIMTPVAGSAQKPSAKLLFAPAAPQVINEAPQTNASRPSAGRLSIRAPSSVLRDFKTPDPRGRRAHWDVGDVDPEPDMDHNVQASNSIRLEGVELDDEEDELEYMPPTAIVEEYRPMFDMPDMQAFGKAVRSLTYSHWPRGEVNILDTIRDEEVVDSHIDNPSFHDLSMLDPPEDNPFPPRKLAPTTLKPLDTRGRSTTVSGKGPKSAPHTRPASVAAVRSVSSSGAPKVVARPVSVVLNRPVSVANVRPPPTVPPTSSQSAPLRRPGTAPGIRPGEGTARVAGKMMISKPTQTKVTQRQPVETHVVDGLDISVDQLALNDEFVLEL